MPRKKEPKVDQSIINSIDMSEKLRAFKARIEQEKDMAIKMNLVDTPLRPFLFEEEQWGAMICSIGRCGKPSKYVSYIAEMKNARLAYCEEHGMRHIINDALKDVK